MQCSALLGDCHGTQSGRKWGRQSLYAPTAVNITKPTFASTRSWPSAVSHVFLFNDRNGHRLVGGGKTANDSCRSVLDGGGCPEQFPDQHQLEIQSGLTVCRLPAPNQSLAIVSVVPPNVEVSRIGCQVISPTIPETTHGMRANLNRKWRDCHSSQYPRRVALLQARTG